MFMTCSSNVSLYWGKSNGYIFPAFFLLAFFCELLLCIEVGAVSGWRKTNGSTSPVYFMQFQHMANMMT